MKAANEVISTDNPVAVTFDTLAAARELKETGLDDRQARAIVATISKAMSETVATKADLELQGAATRAEFQAIRAEMKLLEQSFDNGFAKMELRFKALEQSIIIKLGALMVTMAFLLPAIGPFYIRWVLSMMGAG